MSLNIAHLLNTTLTIRAPTAATSEGGVTLGTAYTLPCRAEQRETLVRLPDGNTKRGDYVVATTVAVPARAFVWLEGDDDTDLNEARRKLDFEGAGTPSGFMLYETVLSSKGG